MALSSKAEFQFNPTIDDVKKYLQKRDKKKITEKDILKLSDDDKQKIKNILIEEENNKMFSLK